MVENVREIVTYDYKTIVVRRDMEAMTVDAYENLGWEFVGGSTAGGAIFHVNLSFKRDRKIEGKQNLLKLQERVDGTLQNIEALQNKKKSAGSVPSLTTGIAGALTFGGGMSMAMLLGVETIGFMVGGIALGVLGMAIALFAWTIYKKVKKSSLRKIEPLLENEYNRLADLCEEAK